MEETGESSAKRPKVDANGLMGLVDPADVALLVAQYCRELKCFDTMKSLQRELQMRYNVLEDKRVFLEVVKSCKFDEVYEQIRNSNITLRTETLALLHELTLIDLCQKGEHKTAEKLFVSSEAVQHLKEKHLPRYKILIQVIQKKRQVDLLKERGLQIDALVELLEEELIQAQPSQLVRTLGDAIKWQKLQGQWPKQTELLARHAVRLRQASTVDEKEKPEEETPSGVIQKKTKTIRFGADSYAEFCTFSPDKRTIATASCDGFIELWDCRTGSLRMDLAYQKADELMMHSDPVLCLAFSPDGSKIASGCKAGKIKVWNVADGKCETRFKRAHAHGVLSLAFSEKGTILSGGFDHKVKVFGMTSGNMLKELSGHTSYVNCVTYYGKKQEMAISASSDATIRLWQVSSASCLNVIRMKSTVPGENFAVNKVLVVDTEKVLVCNRSSTLYILEGSDLSKVTHQFTEKGAQFVSATAHRSMPFIYGATQAGKIVCFNESTGTRVSVFAVDEENNKELIGIDCHPDGKSFAVHSLKGPLHLYT